MRADGPGNRAGAPREDGTLRGEVAESAEGNRLLSGYRVLSLVPGSNPGLSATSPSGWARP